MSNKNRIISLFSHIYTFIYINKEDCRVIRGKGCLCQQPLFKVPSSRFMPSLSS